MIQSGKSKPDDEKKLCVSVFKSGGNTTTKSQFTKVWVDLINKIEKGKGNIAQSR